MQDFERRFPPQDAVGEKDGESGIDSVSVLNPKLSELATQSTRLKTDIVGYNKVRAGQS